MKTLFLSSPDRLLMMASLIANVNSALIEAVRKSYPPLVLLQPIIKDERCAQPWITFTQKTINPFEY